MKVYVVIVKNDLGDSYYLTKELKFQDGLSDNVLWEDNYENVENTIKDDSITYNYTYLIEEF